MEQPLRQAYEQAGITEREIAIENVHLFRSTNSLEVSCSLAAPLPETRLRSFESAMAALLPRYALTFTYTTRPAAEALSPEPAPAPRPEAPSVAPVPPSAAVVVKKTNVIEADLPDNGILEGWGNKKENGKSSWRVQMNITDFTDSVYCEATFFEEWKAQRFLFWIESAKKKGKNFVLRGTCRSRKYNPELNFYINDCNYVDRALREDTSEAKRTELHLHTRMSTMAAGATRPWPSRTTATSSPSPRQPRPRKPPASRPCMAWRGICSPTP